MNQAHSTENRFGAKQIYLDETYLKNNPTWHVEDSPWKARQIHKMLCKHKIDAASICEVGCGAGEILKKLSAKNPETNFYGYELSPHAFDLCKVRESDKVKYFMDDLIDTDAYFDVSLCIDVFEHIEDYIGFLRKLKTKANLHIFHIPLDITVISVLRNTMVRERNSVGHLHYFTLETAIATLEDSGFEVLDYFFTPSFKELPRKTWKSRIMKGPRMLLYSISPRLMVKVFGGCSLLVLAK